MIDKELTYYEEEVNGHRFRMVSLPGGTFEMGNPTFGRTTLKIELSPFYIGEYLVTQALWDGIMGVERNISRYKGSERPVENVSFKDIIDGNQDENSWPSFLSLLNDLSLNTRPKEFYYTLPTEAQWEFAAKSNVNQNYRFSGGDLLKQVSWYDENTHNETKVVGLKKPNAFNLYDMIGNVWEWCRDYYDSEGYYKYFSGKTRKDPINADYRTYGLTRGGSFTESDIYCGMYTRLNWNLTTRRRDIGFRLALTKYPGQR